MIRTEFAFYILDNSTIYFNDVLLTQREFFNMPLYFNGSPIKLLWAYDYFNTINTTPCSNKFNCLTIKQRYLSALKIDLLSVKGYSFLTDEGLVKCILYANTVLF